jgi:hypothetical protein
MMINDSRTDYLCTDVDTAIEAVCQEISVRMRSEGRRERLNRFRTTARQHYQDFVENLYEYDASKQDEGTTRDVHDFLFWAEHQPAYEGYTTKDIIHVLKREFKVSQIAQFYAEFVELSSKRVLRREQASSKRAARLPQNITSAVA